MPHEFNNDESPWDDAPHATPSHAEAEWTKLSSDFQNAGYRDGITAGKESALQDGFDAGFAHAGAPRGRELGLLRGLASALHLHLSRAQTQTQVQGEGEGEGFARAAREIADALATVRFTDVAPSPPPEEAEHVQLHDAGCDEGEHEHEHEEEEEMGGGGVAGSSRVRTMEDVRALRVRLETLLRQAGLRVDLDLE